VISRLRNRANASSTHKETANVTQLRRCRNAIFSATAVLIAAAAILPVASASAAPAWDLKITHSPATFHRGEGVRSYFVGDNYMLTVTNTGDAPTSGPFTITNTLPVGLTVSGETFEEGGSGIGSCTGDGSAELAGARVLTCTVDNPLAPGASQQMRVLATVSTEAADLVTDTATISGGGAGSASASEPTPVADRLLFEVSTFTAANTEEGGGKDTVAGGHPFKNSVAESWPRDDQGQSIEVLRNLEVNPVTGFVGNPAARPRCPIPSIPGEFESSPGSSCPIGSRVGSATVFGDGPEYALAPLYNVKPDRGYPAEFAFKPAGGGLSLTVIPIYVTLRPRSESYGLTVGTVDNPRAIGLAAFNVRRVVTNFCNYPQTTASASGCDSSAGQSTAPFLSNSVNCSEAAPTWKLFIDSWEQSGRRLPTGVPDFTDPNWKTATATDPPLEGCDDPALASLFDPAIAVKPLQGGAAQADAPSGLSVDFDFPQTNDPTDLGTTFDPSLPRTPEPKDITVKLPAGLSISPSSASGLGACSDQASDPAGDQVHYDNTQPVSCPDSSKIGSAVATSPVLALRDPQDDTKIVGPEPIPGDVYLLAPHPGDLPTDGGGSDGKFRLLIQLNYPRYGINFKLPGTAVADPNTGQLTATFSENPQLPSSHITVSLKEGPRAPLATPVACGTFTTTSDLVPWSTPGTPDAHPSASFEVKSGPNGSACPSGASSRPFAPTMSAGTANAKAGAHSPFVLHIARKDGEGELRSLEATLPKGLGATFAGVPYCPEAALAAAAGRSGKAEQANPSCPASRIGSVKVGAGPGTNPYQAKGNAYLSGPYKGAPLSVAVITPAVAGPFDLGTVVSRNALYVNPETAQGHVVSDPLPTIIDGVPLRLRSIDVNLDRSNFTLNPTDCEPLSVQATIHSSDGASASPSNSFQVRGCKDLGFKPTLKLSLKGKVSRRSHPSLHASLTARPGDANIAKAQVKLPKAAFLDNAHIGDICTRVQFAAKQCPAGSVYGYATATTPLLDGPLTGNVYLRANPAHKLPDLVVGFQGPANQQIEVELAGKTDSVKGALRNTFEAVPDVPVTKFDLTLFGGKKGLIIMSSGFCKDPTASIKFTGQNGMESDTTPKVGGKCPKKGDAKGKGNKGKGNKAKGPKGKKGKGAESRNGGGHRRLTAFVPGW
jgi:hypothetical protein